MSSTGARSRVPAGFLNLKYAPDDPQRGYVFFVCTDSGELRPDTEKQTDGYSRHWGLGYGVHSTSMFGLLCYTWQAQLGNDLNGERYRDQILHAANLYAALPPNPQENDLWAGEYATAFLLELAVYRLTGEQQYLDAAQTLGESAIQAFWDEDRILPRASTRTTYGDVVSYTDILILAFLALHEHLAGLDPQVPISDLIR